MKFSLKAVVFISVWYLREDTLFPFISSHRGITTKATFFPLFLRISIGKTGGRVSYCCQMFFALPLCEQMLHAGRSPIFLAGANSNKTLHYTFRWRRVSVVSFGVFSRSIMCSNCIAWNDLEIIYVTVRPFGVYFHEPQWRPHAAARFVLNLCFTVTKPSSSAFASEFYHLLKRGILYIIHITLVFTTCEVLDKCIIRKQSLLWWVYNPGRKKKDEI